MSEHRYLITEIFFSLQGEGIRAGTANVFVRAAQCNLACSQLTEGFFCDTDFSSGVRMTAAEIVDRAAALHGETHDAGDRSLPWVIFTGGEPMLQLDDALVAAFRERGWRIAIETNGTKPIPRDWRLDHVCVSPKTAEHTIVAGDAGHPIDELKYVRRAGMGIPRPRAEARAYVISPAFQPDGNLRRDDLQACIDMVKAHPTWRLSVQQHKGWSVR